MTLTNEPFQPVRLYYSIPGRDWVLAKLRPLECLVEVPDEQCWQWLFQAEAAALRFGGGYEDVPQEQATCYSRAHPLSNQHPHGVAD